MRQAAVFCFKVARKTGLEPATPSSTGLCANQLRHFPT